MITTIINSMSQCAKSAVLVNTAVSKTLSKGMENLCNLEHYFVYRTTSEMIFIFVSLIAF